MESEHQFSHLLKKAHNYEADGKFLHALQIYVKIAEEHGTTEAVCSAAEIYDRTGHSDAAIAFLKSYLNREPENKDIRLFLGQYLLRNSRWNDAIEYLEYLLPEEEPVASFFLGFSYFMLEEYESAKINFLNFVSIENQTELLHEAHIYLAKIEIQLKNYKSALQYAQKANVIYSNFWELNLIFAISYFSLGMYAHAVLSIEKAISLNSGEPSPYEWAGKIYFKLGDYEKAEDKFTKYIELIDDASSEVYTRLAEACLKRNKAKDAVAYFDVAIKIDPENAHAIKGKQNASDLLRGMTIDG